MTKTLEMTLQENLRVLNKCLALCLKGDDRLRLDILTAIKATERALEMELK